MYKKLEKWNPLMGSLSSKSKRAAGSLRLSTSKSGLPVLATFRRKKRGGGVYYTRPSFAVAIKYK